MQEALRRRIERELPLTISPAVKNKLAPSIQKISLELGEMKQRWGAQGTSGGAKSVLRLPPCMKRLLRMVQSGENVPHVGRFALTAFLHELGSSSQDIVDLFGTSADFDEDKTRYQVEHITGKISGTEYTPPSCETMRTYGLCWEPDELCERVKHPLTYYRRKR
jgi:DNA primase large subunit